MLCLEERLVATSFKGPSFDQIRLAAATVVLLYHSRGVSVSDIRVDPLFLYSGGYVQFGLLAVLVFFSISGFLVTPGLVRSGKIIEYMVNRALRVFPALIVVVIGSMLMLGPALTTFSLASYFSDPRLYLYAKNITTWTYNYLPGVFRGDQLIIVNGALWTLHYEVLSYAALALMSLVGVLRWRKAFLVLFLATYSIYVVVNFRPTMEAILTDRFVTFISLFVYFAAGAILYIFRDRIPFSMAFTFGAFAIMLVALPYGLGPIFMPLCLPYITIFCGLSVLPGRSLIKRDLSYGVYLIHAPILVAFIVVFPGVKLWWFAAAIVFCVTVVLSYLSSTLVEQPALRQKKIVSDWIRRRIETLRPIWTNCVRVWGAIDK